MPGVQQVTSPAHITLKIAEEVKIGRNANIVCKANEELIRKIKECITSSEIEIGIVDRKKKNTRSNPKAYIGINADSINEMIRNNLKAIDNLCFETNVEYGGFFERNTKSNFDFSFYDRMFNYCSFWNHNNKSADLKQIIESTIQDRDSADWQIFKNTYHPQERIDVIYQGENDCNIVGEIQMGNWALIYKDIFRLLRAKNSPGVHLYVYITNTGFLKDKLSDGVVTYDKALAELQENLDVIDVPILVLGVDVDYFNEDEFDIAHSIVLRKKRLIESKLMTLEDIQFLEEKGFSLDKIEDIANNHRDGLVYITDNCRITYITNDNNENLWLFEFDDTQDE